MATGTDANPIKFVGTNVNAASSSSISLYTPSSGQFLKGHWFVQANAGGGGATLTCNGQGVASVSTSGADPLSLAGPLLSGGPSLPLAAVIGAGGGYVAILGAIVSNSV